jgi:CRP-like cAMP-binding protein
MPNEDIFIFGDSVREMYFLNEGIVELKKRDKQTKKVEKIQLSSGEHFGESGILTFWRTEEEAKALTFCIMSLFTKDAFRDMI